MTTLRKIFKSISNKILSHLTIDKFGNKHYGLSKLVCESADNRAILLSGALESNIATFDNIYVQLKNKIPYFKHHYCYY
jgi:hypothetical protein